MDIRFFDIVMAEINGEVEDSGVVVSYGTISDIKRACDSIDRFRTECDSSDLTSIVVDVDAQKSDVIIRLFTDSVEINKNDMYFANIILNADYFTMSTNDEGDLVISIGFQNIWEGN